MSGQKQDKFRISVLVACNSTGTEKEHLMFIGKFKRPRVFRGKDPARMRPSLYYRANKKAWMTGVFWEEWLRKLDRKMRQQRRHIVLTVDNFSGHKIAYQPTNIEVIFFAPNLTSHVQPCDAGIIRCLKAHYRRFLALRALDLYEINDPAPFKIDILSAMRFLSTAWDEVTPTTIANCWAHTRIYPTDTEEWEDIFVDPDAPDSDEEEASEAGSDHASDMEVDSSHPPPSQSTSTGSSQSNINPIEEQRTAWGIVLEFARTEMSLPQAEKRLSAALGSGYLPSEWVPILKVVMDAEKDAAKAEADVLALMPDFSKMANPSPSSFSIPHLITRDRHLREAENAFAEAVQKLRDGRCIRGDEVSIDDLLDPPMEREDPDSELLRFSDGDAGILEIVQRIRADAVAVEEEEQEEPVEEAEFTYSNREAFEAIELLQKITQHRPDLEEALVLNSGLHKLRTSLRREGEQAKVQTTLISYFK